MMRRWCRCFLAGRWMMVYRDVMEEDLDLRRMAWSPEMKLGLLRFSFPRQAFHDFLSPTHLLVSFPVQMASQFWHVLSPLPFVS